MTDEEDVIVVHDTLIETVTTGADEVEVLETIITDVFEVGSKGDKGDKGDQGDQGIQGIQGVPGSGTFAYVHDQMIPANPWVIHHNLNGFPNVTVVDSSQREVEGDVTYTDVNTMTITFVGPFAGKAYLS
jgi:hypothetical protein